jgi:hypothetical protein
MDCLFKIVEGALAGRSAEKLRERW